jgi:serine/threonine protein kinase
MELSVQNVYGLLIRSKLLSLDDAKAMYSRWQAEAKGAANDVGQFARWMVANHYVTDYQATMLARGHAEGFFLNQYKILDRIGRGRMAGVYRAVHQLGGMVAIKVLPPSKARDPQLLARFQREANLALRLKHPNVVRTFQTSETNGLHYLVMEHLEGETLEEVLKRRGQLSVAEAVRVVYQALLGLQHLHEQGLVHRDLKPANLMLVPPPAPESTLRCTVKILDIGLGRALFDETISTRANDPTLTSEGALLGTPDYMAPEQARDARSVDIRSDIYSLGCVLYHCLAGQPPFPDTNVISQMIRHATEPPPPLKQFNAALPDGLQQVVNWMLAKSPSQRYPTPGRAAQALYAFLGGGQEPPVSPEADPRMRSYLTWLESDGKKPAARPVAAGLPPPAGPPLAVPAPKVAAAALRPAKSKKHAAKRRSKKHRRKTSALAISPPPAAESPPLAQPLEIELVPAGSLAAEAGVPAGRVRRRDVLIFAAGVASTCGAAFVGWLVAHLLRKKELPADDPNDLPPENPSDKKGD